MFDLDLQKFWEKDKESHENNCFSPNSKQVSLGIRMSDECVFAELNEPGDPWGNTPREHRIKLNRRYNDIAEKVVGRRLLAEKEDQFPTADMQFPNVKQIGEVFEGTYESAPFTGQWLHSPINTPKTLEQMLDRVDKLNLEEFMYPKNWESEKTRIFEKYGKKPGVLRWIRGPVTLAMSIYGEENLIFLFYDEPELFERFSQSISRVILEMSAITDKHAGFTDNFPRGYGFADDNCALLNPEMYEKFGYPVIKSVFDKYSPDKNDRRYQHSDSDMAHLLPILSKLNFSGVNFGPTVLIDQIREYMPDACIDGCLAPFTFMSNDYDKIIAEVKRDCEMIKKIGGKGLNLTTAGSINNGSSIMSMKAVMWAINEYGQY